MSQVDRPVVKVAEARWPAIITLLAVGGTYGALPSSLAIGPRWLLLVVVVLLLVPTVITHRRGDVRVNKALGQIISCLVTGFMVWSLALLIRALPTHAEAPVTLLRSAAALWVTNVLVFSLWYWRLDAGGPHMRLKREGFRGASFLFPQMTLHSHAAFDEQWSPIFVDYLFLAFNTSTALSPTDTAVLSRWAKLLVMVQAFISLTIIVILAGRAVNIL